MSQGASKSALESINTIEQHPYVTEFLDHLNVERRVSEHTISSYGRELDQFVWNSAPPVLEDTRIPHIRDHVLFLQEQGLSPRSISHSLSVLRTFFNFQIRKKRLKHNPASHIKGPKVPQRLPEILDVDEMLHLLASIDRDSPNATRNIAVVELIYSSGLRISEVVGLNWGNVDLDTAQARILGKGNKMRVVPIGRHAVKALHTLRASATNVEPEYPIFVNRNRARISVRRLQMIVKEIGEQVLGVTSLHPHLLRHCSASHLLESSGNIRAVQDLLGHESLRTTQIYTHLDFMHMAKVYDQAHPRARMEPDSKK